MEIFIGADYKGLEKKEKILQFLAASNDNVTDVGVYEYREGDDFNDPAVAVAKAVREDSGALGILICGSGHGMTIQANRFKGIRATLCDSADSVISAKKHDDANVLCLSSDRVSDEEAVRIVDLFLKTEFEPLERRVRRMNRLDEREDYA